MTPADWSVIAILLACGAAYELLNRRDQRKFRREDEAREAAHRARETARPSLMDDCMLTPLTPGERQAWDAIETAAKARTDRWS